MNDNNHVFLNGNEFYLKGGADYEIYSATTDKIYFIECRNEKYLLKSVDHNGENEEIIRKVSGFVQSNSKGNITHNEDFSGFIFSSEQETIELKIEDIYAEKNVGKILQNFDFKAYDCVFYDSTLYFCATAELGWYNLFLCFKYQKELLIFVDCCIYDVDSVSICKIIHKEVL